LLIRGIASQSGPNTRSPITPVPPRREFLRAPAPPRGLFSGLRPRRTGRPGEQGGHAKSPRSPDGFATDETPTPFEDATSYNNFYEFGTDKGDPSENASSLVTKPWSVAIEGEVAKPGSVPLEQLLSAAPAVERIYRLRCVEAWSMVIPWRGLPLGRCSRA
jgi:sulfoxide reductase catalytic subunit YedY